MIRFNDPEHGFVIANVARCTFAPQFDVCIGRVDEDEELLGGVIFTAYTGTSLFMHMAGFRDRWANRDMLWCAFDYPFRQLKCRKVFAQVPETNTKALEIDLKLGFKIITKIDDVYPDGGVHVLSMDRADCKWLAIKPKHIRSLEEA